MSAITDVMSLFTEHARNIVEILLHFLFPVSCEVCGRPGVKICPDCKPPVRDIPPERLIPLLFEGEGVVREARGLTVYAAADLKDELAREAVRRLKITRELCRPLGRHLAEKFGKCSADYLIPVPLHLFSKRGYNQAREIAEGMREVWGIEIIDAALWTRDVHHTDGITYEDFRLTRDIYGKRVVLVDDACISGRTLGCFAETCKRDGAEVVCAYTLACSEVKAQPQTSDIAAIEDSSYAEKRYASLYRFFTGEVIVRQLQNLTVYSAANYHESGIREEIHKLKYTGGIGLCSPMGRHMAEKFGECMADYLLPVPLHIDSERGYNQSLKLAERMCELWNVKILDAAVWTRDVPRRAVSESRADISPSDFRITQDIRGKRIALVDDVCTSGMTLSCLAESCRNAGAIVVCAYTLASV